MPVGVRGRRKALADRLVDRADRDRRRGAPGDKLAEDDWRAIASQPLVAGDLLCEVQRFDGVCEMIARQHDPCAVDSEARTPFTRRDRAEQGRHRLHLCADYVTLRERG